MAKGTVHTVTVNGQLFKRTSANRTYSHVIMARNVRAELLATARDTRNWKHDRSEFAYWSWVAAQQPGVKAMRPGGSFATSYSETEVADAAERIAGCADADAYAAKVLAARVARAEADPLDWKAYGLSLIHI